MSATFLAANLLLLSLTASAQTPPTLAATSAPSPMLDPLRFNDGTTVASAKQWPARRAEIFQIFEREEYGQRPPGTEKKLRWHVDEVAPVTSGSLAGIALRKRITLFFPAPSAAVARQFPHTAREMHLLLYTPLAKKSERVPVVLGVSFAGTWATADDPGVPLGTAWPTGLPDRDLAFTDAHPATEADRTHQLIQGHSQWQARKILQHGFGLATFYYADLEPDGKGGWPFGVRPLFFRPGQTAPAVGDWGAFSVWAWGSSRALDYLQTDPNVDPLHVAITGHSRLAKTADWTSATDTRFWLLLSNEGGKAGDSILHRLQGEPIAHLWDKFPYWFTPAFGHWANRDAETPFDGNLLISLTAPRPVYVGSAIGDAWSDPLGEFLSAKDVGRVYALFGKQGLGVDEQPPLDTPVMHDVGYHLRTGKHDVTAFDWDAYLKFMEMHLH